MSGIPAGCPPGEDRRRRSRNIPTAVWEELGFEVSDDERQAEAERIAALKAVPLPGQSLAAAREMAKDRVRGAKPAGECPERDSNGRLTPGHSSDKASYASIVPVDVACPSIPHLHECAGPESPRNDNGADGVYEAKKCTACGCTCRGAVLLISAAVVTEIIPFSSRKNLLVFLRKHKDVFGGVNRKIQKFGLTNLRMLTLSEIFTIREIVMKPYSHGAGTHQKTRNAVIEKLRSQITENGAASGEQETDQ